jgi:hypothetical protein
MDISFLFPAVLRCATAGLEEAKDQRDKILRLIQILEILALSAATDLRIICEMLRVS